MKKGNFISSFNYAVQGIISALKTEKNMKLHYLAALGVIIISLFMNFSRVEFMLLIFAITFVVAAEMINTAIERTIDLIVQDYNPIAKYIKDVSAGAVLISAINALVTAYLLFYDRISNVGDLLLVKLKNSVQHLSFISVLIVLILTVGGKYLWAKKNGGTYFQGGAISGHTSLAFCAATIIALISENTLITLAAFGIAFLVAESRVEGGIHKISEVVSGAVLGILVVLVVFRIIG
ncbi:diacylglycerol kinase (ATP) [Anaerosphaera aminiphila DSM 21120]|uniref:Diacylglycerol kinase (ATP) n=1 Tax=Anaerosphaera aminiphila DSM 21120 TaxID=1120995 RepID=A0A1M5RJ28_9FIRM|nr:diacylglycerol kinase [Anaerosphaera aminiphila]SHH26337.1 diacylglycerol kinase (ATP) [Anaerosphaera aminiphila DSM 21120]